MRKSKLLVGLAALTTLAGCGISGAGSGSASTAAQVTVRIPDPGNAGVLAVGKKDGSLAKALARVNATVAWTGSAGPFAPAAQAMNANQLDIAIGSITSGITSLAQKPGFKFFTAMAPDTVGAGILTKKDSGIDRVEDLIDKKVAVNRGGTGEYLLLKALAENHIPARKVKRVYLPPDQTAAVFNTGKVDAWAVWSTYSVTELGTGRAKFVATGRQIDSDNYSLTAVRTAFAQQHPRVVKALYDYLHAGSIAEKKNPAAYLNVNTNVGPQALNDAAQRVQIDIIAKGGTVEPITAADIERFKDVARFYADQKVTKTAVDIGAHLIDVEQLS